ncbi:MAG: alanine racemase [Bacteroidales bacterium]|nr:alanine racemase [Bacteroidales bacterium]MDY0142060.1 alanine racemase [Bacteroidales bacterium]
MLKYSKIKSPIFAINTDIAKKNIIDMQAKLPDFCTFRPHFKTHDNKKTAKIFKEFEINKITVSSVEMALYFRKIGFKDIIIAFPVNIREQKRLNKLCSNTTLGLTFSNLQSVKIVSKLSKIKANAWIEIDTGYNRSGILWKNHKEIETCIKIIKDSSNLNFKGFLTHNGSTYSLQTKDDILNSTNSANAKMFELKSQFASYNPMISIGDTPSCSLLNNFDGINEIRPGNFVYYDLMMLQKAVCTIDKIAATMFCPIVDINPERNEIVIHGGAVHFSKEFIEIDGQKNFGQAIKHIGKDINDIDEKIISLSQEHGIIKITKTDIKLFNIGDLLEIIPVHSCLTANLMKGKTLHL